MTELLHIRVQPRSSQNKVTVSDGVVKVWVTAAPTDGQANEAVCKLVAKALGIPTSSVQVAKGHKSRDKALDIHPLSVSEAMQILAK